MIVLDYIRLNYANSNGELSLGNSKAGKELAKIITAPRKGFGLTFDDVDIEFAYGAVPPLNALGKPKKLTAKLTKPYFEKLHQKIAKVKPDLVLGMGSVALEALSGYTGIAKKRGIPFQKDFDGYAATVLPTYSIEYTWLDTTKGSLLSKDVQLGKTIMRKGIGYFKKGQGDYQLINQFDQVKTIFNQIFKHQYPIIAVDFETNSLHGEYQDVLDKNGTGKKVSAKPIVLSLSWKEKMGVAIPLAHKDADWSPDQLKQIYNWIKQLFMDNNQWKVMHNGKFDITFLKETIGLPYSVKTVDTMIMYYIGVTEDPKVPKGLKELAYQYTDMGGYESPLDDYKQEYLEQYHQDWLDQREKDKSEKGIKYYKKDYQPPVNEVDGDTFNYEWIPMKIIYPYAAADTDVCLRIYYQLKPLIKGNPKWENLIYNYYPKLQDSLTDIMASGLMIDKEYAKDLKQVYEDELNKIIKEIYQVSPEIKQIESDRQELLMKRDLEYKKKPADRDAKIVNAGNKYRGTNAKGYPKVKFNFNSSKDKQYLFYNLLGYELPFDKEYLTKTAIERGAKESNLKYTDFVCDGKHALPYLVEHYHSDLAKLFLRYNKLNKALTSFIVKLPKLVDNRGLLHSNFGMTNTVTSRLISNNPNTQQLVRRTGNPHDFNYKRSIKGMFKSRFKGGVLVNIDFKTLEVYVAALRSQDPNMEQALIDGIDFHTNTARRIWHISDNQKVTGNVRSTAKAATFGRICATV